jgi:hypothetical protein
MSAGLPLARDPAPPTERSGRRGTPGGPRTSAGVGETPVALAQRTLRFPLKTKTPCSSARNKKLGAFPQPLFNRRFHRLFSLFQESYKVIVSKSIFTVPNSTPSVETVYEVT